MRQSFALSLIVLILSAGYAAAGGDQWMTDLEAAKAKAAESNKYLLVEFTGSDWCPPCKKMKKEVFSQEAFLSGASEKFILVELDFPRDKSKLTPEQHAHNIAARERYEVKGFPTVLLADARGKEFARSVGYRAGGPEAFIKYLDRQIEAKGILAEAEKAEGPAKAKLLDRALNAMGYEAIAKRDDLVDQIIEIDADNTLGLKNKYECSRAITGLTEMPRDTRPQKLLDKLNGLIEQYQPTGDNAQHLYFYKGLTLMRLGKMDQGLELLNRAVGAAPDSNRAGSIRGYISRIEKGLKAKRDGQDDDD